MIRTAVLALSLLASTAANAEEAKPVDNIPKLAFGQMVQQGDKLVFAPCRDRSYTFLEDVSSDGRVLQALNQVGLSAGKKIYVEVLGVLEGGFLKASQINLAKTNGRCQLPGGAEEQWRASGNEPGWILAVGTEAVQMKPLDKPELALMQPPPVKLEKGVASFQGAKGDQKLSFRFEQKLCHDSMADAVFGWTASVQLNGQTYKGCAWQR